MSYDGLLNPYASTNRAYADATDPGALFKDATWDSIDTNPELRDFLKRAIDPDDSKYGGDFNALKTGILNDLTTRGSSITLQAFDKLRSGTETINQAQVSNLLGRLYNTAPNRLFSGDASQAGEALKAGLTGALGYDAPLNILLAPLSLGKTTLQALGTAALAREGVEAGVKAAAINPGLAGEAVSAATRGLTLEAAKQGALREGGINAVLGTGSELLAQSSEVDRGLRKGGVDVTDAVLEGGILGGVAGGVFGAAGGALSGRGLARELAGDAKPNIMRDLPEGERSVQEMISKEAATIGPQRTGTPDVPDMQVATADAYAKVKSVMEEGASAISRLRRDVEAGNATSAYTPEQLSAIEMASARLSNVQALADAELARANSLAASQDPAQVAEANVARVRASTYQRMAQEMLEVDFDDGNVIDGADVNPAFVGMLVQQDDNLARVLGLPVDNSGKGGGSGGGGAPTTGGAPRGTPRAAAPAPAPAATAAPAAPAPAPAPEIKAATVEEQPATAPEIAASKQSTDTAVAQAAETVETMAAKLNKDAGEFLASLRGMDEPAITELSQQLGTEPTVLRESAERLNQAVEQKRVVDATEQARAEQAAAPQPETVAEQAGVADDAAAVADEGSETVDEVAGAAEQADTQSVAEQALRLGAAQSHSILVARTDDIATKAEAALDAALADVLVKVEEAKARGDVEKAADLARVVLDKAIADATDPAVADVLSQFSGKDLTSAKKVEAAKVKIREMVERSISWTYAQGIGSIMPDATNFAHFSQIIDALPGIPASSATKIKEDYRLMLREALTERISAVGFDNARREFGDQFDTIMAGATGLKLDKVQLGKLDVTELITKAVEGAPTPLTEKQLGIVRKAAREAKALIENSGFSLTKDMAEQVISARIYRAVSDIVSGRFEFENSADFAKIKQMVDQREAPAGRWIGRGSLVENPIVQGMELVTGRSINRDGFGVQRLGRAQGILTDGLGGGLLWGMPRNAYRASVIARRDILMGGIAAASNRKTSMTINGVKMTAPEKELKGLYAEVAQRLVDQRRAESIQSAVAKREAGEIDDAAFDAEIERIGSTDRKVQVEEIALARQIHMAELTATESLKAAKAKTNEILERMQATGMSGAEALADVFASVEKVMARYQDAIVSISKTGDSAAADKVRAGNNKARRLPKGAVAGEASSTKKSNDIHVGEDGKIVLGKRDTEAVAVVSWRMGAGASSKFTFRASDVLQLAPNGDINLFGTRRIGTWKQIEGKNGIEITLPGLAPGRTSDLTAIVNNGRFQEMFLDDFKANVNKAAPAPKDALPGKALDADVANHDAEVAARKEMVTGQKTLDPKASLGSFRAQVPEGFVLVFRRKSDGKVMNAQKSDKDGMTLAEALASKRIDLDNVELGYASGMTARRSGNITAGQSDAARIVEFQPLGQEPNAKVAEKVKAMAARGDNSAVLLRKAQTMPLSEDEAAKLTTPDGRNLLKVAKDFDLAVAGLQWSQIGDRAQLSELVTRLAEQAQVLRDVLPMGLLRNNTSRRTAFHWLSVHLGGQPRAAIEQAYEVLRRMDAAQGELPLLYKGDGDSMFNPGSNQITLGGNTNGLPAHVTVIHEAGHWAFLNMLSPAEQLQFIASLSRYFDKDGVLDMAAVRKSMPNMAAVEKVMGRKFKGAEASTNELFAWQWTSYALRQAGEQDLSLWQKVAKYTKNILAKFVGAPVDNELAPLFERIMPAMKGERRFVYDAAMDINTGGALDRAALAADGQRKGVLMVMDSMEKIDGLRARLNAAIMTPGAPLDGGAKQLIEEAADFMFGAVMGKRAPSTAGKGSLRRKLSVVRHSKGKQARTPGVDPVDLFELKELGPLKQRLKELDAGMTDDEASRIAARLIESEDAIELELIDRSIDSNPEMKIDFNRTLERAYFENLKKGMDEDKAQLMAEEEAYAFLTKEYGFSRDTSAFDGVGNLAIATPEQQAAVRKLALQLSDMMSDALDHYETVTRRAGVAVPTTRRLEQRGLALPNAEEMSVKATKVARKRGTPRKTKPAETAEQQKAADATASVVADAGTGKVSDGLPPAVGEVVARVTHRDPAAEREIHTLLTAIFHSVFPETQNTSTAFLTNRHIADLTGMDLGELDANAMASTTSEAFEVLRSAFRKLHSGMKSGDVQSVESLTEMVARATIAKLERDEYIDLPSVDDLVADVMSVMKNPEALNYADLLTRDTWRVVSQAVSSAISDQNLSVAVKRLLGEPEVVRPTFGTNLARYTDGSIPAPMATASIRQTLSALSEGVRRNILNQLGAAFDEGADTVGMLANNYIGWMRSGDKAIYLTPEDAMDAMGDIAVRGTDAELAKALADGDDQVVHAIMSSREAILNESGVSDGLIPVLLDTSKLYDLANGAAPSNKVLREQGFAGTTNGATARLLGNKVPTSLSEATAVAVRDVKQPVDPNAPGSSEIALYAALEDAPLNPLAVEQRTLFTGATRSIAKIAANPFRKNAPDALAPAEVADIRRSRLVQLAENSVRIARNGGQWLANAVKPQEGTGFYDALAVRTGSSLMPLADALDRLGDRAGVIKQTLSGLYSNLAFHKKGMPQSTAEDNVVMALRKGDLSKLTKAEGVVAVKIKEHMRAMLAMQREAGMPVGDLGDNYLPQRFNLAWINANRDEAISRLAKWFAKDSGQTVEQTTERARRVIDNAINREELSGILDASSNVYTQAFGEKLYSRKLHIDGADWDQLGPLFDQNLKSLMISYTEAAHKRVEWAKRFGIRGHAAQAYTEIAENGDVGVISALLAKAKNLDRVVSSGVDDVADAAFTQELFSPLTKDAYEAEAVLRGMLERIRAEGDTVKLRQEMTQELIEMHKQAGGMGTMHFAKQAEAIVNGTADFVARNIIVPRHEVDFMRTFIGVVGGRPAYTVKTSYGWRNAAGYMRTFNSVSLLSGAVISSLGDPALALARGGDFKAWMKGMSTAALKARSDPAFQAAMGRVAVGIESVLNENIFHLQGSNSGRISNAFFLANGLTAWTNAARQIAALTGFESIKANQAIIRRERAAGRLDSWKHRRALRFLRQLGVAHLADEAPLDDFVKAVDDGRVAEAIHKFTNESVFQPNRNDMPLWTQDPLLGLLWQFKSYPVMMGRLIKRSFNEAVAMENGKYVGNPKHLAYLASVGVALGMGTVAIKDLVQGRNEEADKDNPSAEWRSLRDRTFSKVAQEFGFKDYEMEDAEKDKFLGWYIEGVLQMGALGFLGDMLYQTAAQADNGAFGQNQVISRILGPWIGTFQDGLTVLGGGMNAITEGEEDGNTDERTAVRKLVRRVPFVGTQKIGTEEFVNWVAGEQINMR